MKRGFPRPQMHVDKTRTHRVWNESEDRYSYIGSYGEKWDGKNYPVPYTAEEDAISQLHSGRMRECVAFKRCVACGEPVQEEIISLMLKKGELHSESGPFHSKCARLTQAMCPHINVGSEYTFVNRRWDEVRKILADLVD